MVNLMGLVEKCRDKTEVFLAMLDGSGFKYVFLEGFRNAKTQRAYWVQGREKLEIVNEYRRMANLPPIKESGNTIITQCDGDTTKSKHQFGCAIDIAPIVGGKIPWGDAESTKDSDGRRLWEQLGAIGKQAGFTWGGDWGKTASKLGWDCPHFECDR